MCRVHRFHPQQQNNKTHALGRVRPVHLRAASVVVVDKRDGAARPPAVQARRLFAAAVGETVVLAVLDSLGEDAFQREVKRARRVLCFRGLMVVVVFL